MLDIAILNCSAKPSLTLTHRLMDMTINYSADYTALRTECSSRFNKIATGIQGTPQMAVEIRKLFAYRESTHTILSVTFPYFMCKRLN